MPIKDLVTTMVVMTKVQLFLKKHTNMKMLKVSIFLFIVAAFSSCDCLQHVQGVVIDSQTRLPIDKVVITENSRDWVVYTDSLGYFEYTSMTVGLFGCPRVSLSFEKEGYNKTTNIYKSCCTDNTIVILEKEK